MRFGDPKNRSSLLEVILLISSVASKTFDLLFLSPLHSLFPLLDNQRKKQRMRIDNRATIQQKGRAGESCYANFPAQGKLKNAAALIPSTESHVVLTGSTFFHDSMMSIFNTSLDLESVLRLTNQLEASVLGSNQKNLKQALGDYASKTVSRSHEFEKASRKFADGLKPNSFKNHFLNFIAHNSITLSFRFSKLLGNIRTVSS